MPNKNSKACHIPIRTCVVCRQKLPQQELLGFILMPSGIVFDMFGRLNVRKQYVCSQRECIALLAKWRKKRDKGRRNR
ncbi:MAG: DUF448 domain-containing protein [Candidatus Cloacimonetes bacterium]|nr:DUF448 domain-containing protein [Candidatus Cloacimonadota bacterium]MDY0299314.1 DUF448 domain-containing protein [Candidatus Cloacimonadaceae bacterium]MCB5279423.1 DUF448 domain-containing protein [Candidatus Cloacimonadota bacterium]MCK9333145.1 DUF448 domain-containing protein [Candidatus Cloacimonadota bacterium]MDD2211247.1 DUF448 domain-containing protein [Candidatus Cloacimonadota bacterium]